MLHLRRKEVLKGLLITVPDLHGPTEYCGYEEQKQLKAQWTFGMGRLAWVLHAGTCTFTTSRLYF